MTEDRDHDLSINPEKPCYCGEDQLGHRVHNSDCPFHGGESSSSRIGKCEGCGKESTSVEAYQDGPEFIDICDECIKKRNEILKPPKPEPDAWRWIECFTDIDGNYKEVVSHSKNHPSSDKVQFYMSEDHEWKDAKPLYAPDTIIPFAELLDRAIRDEDWGKAKSVLGYLAQMSNYKGEWGSSGRNENRRPDILDEVFSEW